jgi:hypothetical protein
VITGLEAFRLSVSSLARLGPRRALVHVHLRSYEVTAAVRRLPLGERHAYLARRVDRWISRLEGRFPHLSFEQVPSQPAKRPRRWSGLPTSLKVHASARDLSALAQSPGVSSVHVVTLAGCRRQRRPAEPLDWFCVRGLVTIRIEGVTSGMQTTEDRFVMVRARDAEDAIARLKPRWRAYAVPYLNSNGQLVSWGLERVVDVYSVQENSIDPAGTEVYSSLGRRRFHAGRPRRPPRKRRQGG